MKRRWIIQGFFIAMLLLCVSGWISSYYVNLSVAYGGVDVVGGASLEWGRLEFFLIRNKRMGTPGIGWYCEATETTSFDPHESTDFERYAWHKRFLGFLFSPVEIDVPLWFFTAVSAVLLWLVWRKTRPKPVGRAFPVEAKQRSAIQEKTP